MDISPWMWFWVVMIGVLVTLASLWVTRQAYSRKWDESEKSKMDEFLDPEYGKQKRTN